MTIAGQPGRAAVQKVSAVRGLDFADGLRAPWLTLWDEVSGRLVRSATWRPRREDARHDC